MEDSVPATVQVLYHLWLWAV